jgi:hypothetical protein
VFDDKHQPLFFTATQIQQETNRKRDKSPREGESNSSVAWGLACLIAIRFSSVQSPPPRPESPPQVRNYLNFNTLCILYIASFCRSNPHRISVRYITRELPLHIVFSRSRTCRCRHSTQARDIRLRDTTKLYQDYHQLVSLYGALYTFRMG